MSIRLIAVIQACQKMSMTAIPIMPSNDASHYFLHILPRLNQLLRDKQDFSIRSLGGKRGIMTMLYAAMRI